MRQNNLSNLLLSSNNPGGVHQMTQSKSIFRRKSSHKAHRAFARWSFARANGAYPCVRQDAGYCLKAARELLTPVSIPRVFSFDARTDFYDNIVNTLNAAAPRSSQVY
jgi:hypothetical protein